MCLNYIGYFSSIVIVSSVCLIFHVYSQSHSLHFKQNIPNSISRASVFSNHVSELYINKSSTEASSIHTFPIHILSTAEIVKPKYPNFLTFSHSSPFSLIAFLLSHIFLKCAINLFSFSVKPVPNGVFSTN